MWQTDLHPSILTLGLLYANGTIRGTNARTVAMLTAFAEVRHSISQNCTRRGAVGRGSTNEGQEAPLLTSDKSGFHSRTPVSPVVCHVMSR